MASDVLHRRCAGGAWNERQVLQPRPALFDGPGHGAVPGLASPHLDHAALGRLVHQLQARDLDLQHHRVDVARQHHIAAAAQHELGRQAVIGVVHHAAQVGLAANAHQRARQGWQAEGVVGTQAGTVLNLQWHGVAGHARIFAYPACCPCCFHAEL
jgi:hypothetical protein